MTYSENIVVFVDLDVSKLEGGVSEIAVRLNDLKSSINNCKGTIDTGITGIQHLLGALKNDICGKVEDAGKNLSSGLTEAFGALTREIKDLFKDQSQNDSVSDIASKAYDTALGLFLESLGILGKAKKGDAIPNRTSNGSYSRGNGMPGQLALPSAGMNQSPSPLGTILLPAAGSGGAAQLEGVDDIVNGITSSGNGLLDGSLTAMFSNLSTVVADAGQKMRDFGSAIGIAFSNFGSAIAQLAASTGTWIANTASKAANTAAQWALLLPGTATGNRWTGPPVQRYEKSPDLTVEACVRVTYLPRQSPAKYCQRT